MKRKQQSINDFFKSPQTPDSQNQVDIFLNKGEVNFNVNNFYSGGQKADN